MQVPKTELFAQGQLGIVAPQARAQAEYRDRWMTEPKEDVVSKFDHKLHKLVTTLGPERPRVVTSESRSRGGLQMMNDSTPEFERMVGKAALA
jgi:hypothetical protein